MEYYTSGQANSSLASQEISHILWNPKFYYRIHKGTPTVILLSQNIQSTTSKIIFFSSILKVPSHLCLGRLSSFPAKILCTSSVPYMSHARPPYSVWFNLFNNVSDK